MKKLKAKLPYYYKKWMYLVERKLDKKRFLCIGNVKAQNFIGMMLWDFQPDESKYGWETPYGRVSNISSEESWDKNGFRILHQTRCN